MDNPEAARLLGVAEAEVLDVKAEAGWWHALHHDMASHEENWRPVPGAPADDSPEPDPSTEGSVGSGSGDQVPDADDPDGPGVDTDGDGVPEGSARQILDWVDDDHDRAAQALAAERRQDRPRTTLIAALEKIVG